MSEKFLILERSVRDDLEAVEEIYAALAPAPLSGEETQEELIVVAFRLHALYSAVENIFRNIARAFENTLDDTTGWHTQLLRRMRLDLHPVRPAVIDASTYEALDELRGFRHVFRSVYRLRLDPRRLSIVLETAWGVRDSLSKQIGDFLEFVGGLRDGTD
ncbi:MAG: antitoxin [bacterium]|nr:antitoxin [bacterium]